MEDSILKEFDVLVIGGGPAAITIAKIIGGKKKIGLIRPEDHSMIYCAMPYVIENVLPFEKSLKKDELVTDTEAVLIRDLVEMVDLITMAIQYGITVKNLVNLSYSSHPYQSFFPANNLMVQASENILKAL